MRAARASQAQQQQQRPRTPMAQCYNENEAPAVPTAAGGLRVDRVVRRLQLQTDAELDNLTESQHAFSSYVEHLEQVVEYQGAPVYATYTEELGTAGIVTMTGLTPAEFDIVWGYVESDMVIRWTSGRRRRSTISPKDSFFMTLCVLKHFNSWYKHAADFGCQPATFERMVTKVISMVEPILSDQLTTPTRMSTRGFNNYPCALYATDVKFQQSNRPTGTFSDAKQYFSYKHSLHGYKFECSVDASGHCVFVTRHFPGSKADVVLFEDHMDIHKKMLKKTETERSEQDYGEGAIRFPESWALLVDMGYQGIQTQVRAIQPKKQPRNGALSADDVDRNRRVSADRVIVENYFGRLSMLWRIMYKKWTLSEEKYDLILRLCVALTNFHISLNPLCAEDADNYQRTLARYASQALAHRRRRQAAQEASLERRRDRLLDRAPANCRAWGNDTAYGTPMSPPAHNSRQDVSPRVLQFDDESQAF